MTGRDDVVRFDIGHPAPGRERVGAFRLVVSFALAPVAWSIQLAAIAALGGTCTGPAGQAMVWPTLGWVAPAIAPINLGALAVALVGVVLSLLNMRLAWQATDRPRGSMMAGEGRVQWMAFGALFGALLFIVAIAFNTVAVFRGGLCPL